MWQAVPELVQSVLSPSILSLWTNSKLKFCHGLFPLAQLMGCLGGAQRMMEHSFEITSKLGKRQNGCRMQSLNKQTIWETFEYSLGNAWGTCLNKTKQASNVYRTFRHYSCKQSAVHSTWQKTKDSFKSECQIKPK